MRLNLLELLMRGTLRSIKRFDRRDNALGTLDPDAIRSVLLITSTALGDAVLSSAAFAPVRQRFPQAHIAALIHPSYVALFRHSRELDDIVPYWNGTSGFLRTLLALRRLRPELVLILHGNEPQATPLAYLAGARWIVKLPNARNPFRYLLSNAEPAVSWADLGHGLNQRLQVAAAVGAEVAGARMQLSDVPEHQVAVDAFLAAAGLAGRPLIGFQCGASAQSRMWPEEKFVALGRRLLQMHPGAGIVLTGSPDEGDYLGKVADGIGGSVAVAAGRTPLEQLPTLVRRLQVLVTGDTGTMHIAFAVSTPTVCLFAVSYPATSGPAYDQHLHTVIYRPCPHTGITPKSQDRSWIARIEVDEVLAAVDQQLLRNPGQ